MNAILQILLARQPRERDRDWGLLIARLVTGGLLAFLHGLPKLQAASGYFLRGEPWRDVDLVVALGLPFPGAGWWSLDKKTR